MCITNFDNSYTRNELLFIIQEKAAHAEKLVDAMNGGVSYSDVDAVVTELEEAIATIKAAQEALKK